ncbi:olfactory receptor class A-like protein 1 [Rhinatrema bivittatum]|uniref:olfactory receptor class A-like protein 1 n=1 Tax=Rhinatrema bivittatum TaxID=194408 RepID=UPI00112830E2|nr:olfactory receptor class A-like protein 1 [Rhinatrema bivittatum]
MGIWFILNLVGFMSLDVIGIPGNLIILFVFVHALTCHRKISTSEIILSKLALSNLLVVLTWGFPLTLEASGLQKVYNDLTCKLSLYFYCVGRAMSICITSLLGCFQCLTVAPSPQRWLHMRQKVLDNLSSIIIGLWCFNLLICSTRLVYSQVQVNSTSDKYILSYDFCFVVFPNYFLYVGNGIIFVARDLFFLSLMSLASGYLLYVFYQHGKQIQGLHNVHKHAEIRAAKAVATLVLMYIFSFGLDSMFWIFTLCMSPISPRFTDARIFFDSCYSAISPVVIILTNKKIQHGLRCSAKKKLRSMKSISKYIGTN